MDCHFLVIHFLSWIVIVNTILNRVFGFQMECTLSSPDPVGGTVQHVICNSAINAIV